MIYGLFVFFFSPLQHTAPPLFGLVMAAFALFLVLIIHFIIVKAVQRKRKFMNDGTIGYGYMT